MWMCENCQEIVDDDLNVCPRCRHVKSAPVNYDGEPSAAAPYDRLPPPTNSYGTPASNAYGRGYQSSGALSRPDPFRIVGLILGIVAIAIAGSGLISEASFKSRANATTGTVMDLNYQISGSGKHGAFYPVISYRTADGQAHQCQGNFGTNDPMQRGDTVTVYYDPNNPDSGKYYDPRADILYWVFVTVGSFMIWVGVARKR